MKWHAIGVPPDDAQFLQSRTFQGPEICRWFDVPPAMVFDLTHAHFKNIEAQEISFAKRTISPWATRWETESDRKLLPTADRRTRHWKFNLNGLMRGDSKAQNETIRVFMTHGIYSINRVLRLLDENTIGPEGDARFVQRNMVPLLAALDAGSAGVPATTSPPRAEGSNGDGDGDHGGPVNNGRPPLVRSTAGVFVDAVERLMHKESNAVARAVGGRNVTAERFGEWVAGYYGGRGPFMGHAVKTLSPPVELLANLVARESRLPSVPAQAISRIAETIREMAGNHALTSTNDLADAFAAGGAEAVGELCEQWVTDRAAEASADIADRAAEICQTIICERLTNAGCEPAVSV